jgi:hypothetical protein
MFNIYDRLTGHTLIVTRTYPAAISFAAHLNRAVEAGRYAIRTTAGKE